MDRLRARGMGGRTDGRGMEWNGIWLCDDDLEMVCDGCAYDV